MTLDMQQFARKTVAVLGLVAITASAIPAQAATPGYREKGEFTPRTLNQIQEGQRPAPPTQEERENREAMTPEQREAAHQQRREAFLNSLTPEQRQEHEARRAEFEKLTPEQRQAKFGERRPPHPGGRGQGQGPRRDNGQTPSQKPQR